MADVADLESRTRWEGLATTANGYLVTLEAEAPVIKWRLEDEVEAIQPDLLRVDCRPRSELVALVISDITPDGSWVGDYAWRARWQMQFRDGFSVALSEPEAPRAQEGFNRVIDGLLDSLNRG